MQYLIDGYNLAHQITLPAGPVGPDVLDRARDQLLRLLADAFGEHANQITVVFDTSRSRGVEPEVVLHGIDVRFAVGEEADDLIERIIKNHPTPRKLTVVSDDHRLQVAARRAGCRLAKCHSFLDSLEARPRRAAAVQPEKPAQPTDDEISALERAFSEERPTRRLPGRHRRRN